MNAHRTVRPIPAEHLHAIYSHEPWTYPEAYRREPTFVQKAMWIIWITVASWVMVGCVWLIISGRL